MSNLFGTAKFINNSTNYDAVTYAEFENYSQNFGEITESALFQNSAVNFGMCAGDALFVDQSSNKKNILNFEPFPVVFSGSSVNKNTLMYAVFLENSVNEGTILGTAVFAASSINKGTIELQAKCYMLDSARNEGNILGTAYILQNSNVTSTNAIPFSGSYSIQDGLFRYGSYNQYKKTKPKLPIKAEKFGSFWYSYDSNGNGNVANGAFNTGEPNGYKYFKNGKIKPFPTNFVKNGIYSDGMYLSGVKNALYTSPGASPEQAVDNFLFYVYARLPYGIRKARGSYSTGYFQDGTQLNITSLATEAPYLAKDNGKFYLYETGWAIPAHGVYSNGCFIDGKINSRITNLLPIIAKNDSKWYNFKNGWYPTPSNGYYSTGYFISGQKIGTQNTPQSAIDLPAYSYTYTDGISFLAQGAYTNGYFNQGSIDTGYFSGRPIITKDDKTVWKIYAEGKALKPQGAFTNGYFINGELSGTFLLPQTAQDNLRIPTEIDKKYVYINGVSSLASGNYSSGYYSQGLLVLNYNNPTRTPSIDNGHLYAYYLGQPIILEGKYWYPTTDESWYNINNWFVDVERNTVANTLPSSGVQVILQGTKNVNIDLLDTRWVQPSSISSSSAGVVFINSKSRIVTCPVDTKLVLRK